jgi:epoxyqueuosine reductase
MALADALRGMLSEQGAALVGYADVRGVADHVNERMPTGVAIAVALDPGILARNRKGPTREYGREYERANALLDTLSAAAAEFLRLRYCRAEPAPATLEKLDTRTLATPLPHKTVATRAGLGWIGKCALLVTEEYGPAVRLTSLLTNALLPTAEPMTESRCGECTACADVCPAGAVSGLLWTPGLAREEFFDAFACRRTAAELASRQAILHTICGRCITACPWTPKATSKEGSGGL